MTSCLLLITALLLTVEINGVTSSSPLKNVAFHKPASQSSAAPGWEKYLPTTAVDGRYDLHISKCFHTDNKEKVTWWMVDLKGFYEIHSVSITNRGDCCGNRLANFTLQIFNQNPEVEPTAKPRICYYYDKGMPDGVTQELVCSQPMIGRFVRIANPNPNQDKPLHVCEVEVWASEPSSEATISTKYVSAKGQVAESPEGEKLGAATTVSSTAQCLDLCNANLHCNAVNVGPKTATKSNVGVVNGWTDQCQLLTFGGIGELNKTTAKANWDFYQVGDA